MQTVAEVPGVLAPGRSPPLHLTAYIFWGLGVFGNQMGRQNRFRECGSERIGALNWPEEGLGKLLHQFRNSGSAWP